MSKVILPGCNRGIITCLEQFDSSCYGVIEDSLQVYIVGPFEVLEFCLFLAKVGIVD